MTLYRIVRRIGDKVLTITRFPRTEERLRREIERLLRTHPENVYELVPVEVEDPREDPGLPERSKKVYHWQFGSTRYRRGLNEKNTEGEN